MATAKPPNECNDMHSQTIGLYPEKKPRFATAAPSLNTTASRPKNKLNDPSWMFRIHRDAVELPCVTEDQ